MLKKSSNSVRVYYPEFSRGGLVERIKERVASICEKLPIRSVIFSAHMQKAGILLLVT